MFKTAARFMPQNDSTVSPNNYDVHDSRNIKDRYLSKPITQVDGAVFTKE